MKKIALSAAALSLLSSVAFADANTSGFYVGAGLGTTIAHGSGTFSFVPTAAANAAFTNTLHTGLSKQSFAGNLLLGYGLRIQCFHLGLEADYTFDSLNAKFNQTTGPAFANNPYTSVKSTGAFGAAIKAGYYCDRFMGFVRLGLEIRKFKMNGNAAFSQASSVGNTLSASATKTGFAPGIGVQYSFSKHVSGTLEYRTAFYGKATKSFTTTTGIAGTTVFKIVPRVSTVLATVRYHF